MKKFMFYIILVLMLISGGQVYASSYHMHTINEGDTYYKVANQYGIDVSEIEAINYQSATNLKPGDLIKVHQIKDISIEVNERKVEFDQLPYIENECVFVPIRFVSEALGADFIDWNQDTKEATIVFSDKSVDIKVGSNIAYVSGKPVKLDAPVQLYVNRTYVPVRFFAEVVGVNTINWDGENYTVSIEKVADDSSEENSKISNVPNYSEEDLYWLSRIVHAEAEAEPYEGKLAVANTIINRTNSPSFPNSIKEVIFDTNYGIQYTPAKNGTINNTPNEDSIKAAKDALEGKNNIGESLYFINPIKSPNSWVENNRIYYNTIANHDFYL